MNTNRKKIMKLVYTAMSIAMVTVLTYVTQIPSIKGGYINFGDVMIFITAAMMGSRTAFFAGSMGSALSDLFANYTAYIPATFVIKGIEGLICGLMIRKDKNKKINIYSLITSVLVSAVWMITGYFLYEYKVLGVLFAGQEYGAAVAVPNLTGNIIQGLVSVVVAVPFIIAIKKTRMSLDIED
jgi:uncharacterized membrane protein